MDRKKVERLLGRANGLERLGGDYDNDGVPNGIDCRPYDPRRQGFIHNIGKNIKEGYKDWREERAADRASERIAREEARFAARDERRKQAVNIAVERERYRAKKQKEYIRSGGFFGQVQRMGDRLAPPKPTQTVRVVRKKGKKARRVTVVQQQPTYKPWSLDQGGKFV